MQVQQWYRSLWTSETFEEGFLIRIHITCNLGGGGGGGGILVLILFFVFVKILFYSWICL